MSAGSLDDFLDDVRTKPEEGSAKRGDFFDGDSSDLSGIDLGNYEKDVGISEPRDYRDEGIEEDFANLPAAVEVAQHAKMDET